MAQLRRRSRPAQRVRRHEPGGVAALGSPYGGAGERSETERAQAAANMENVPRLQPGTLSVTATPCQLSHRESQGAGCARPARRVRQREPGGASRPWLPLWGSWRANSEPERAQAVASLGKCTVIATGYPLSLDYYPPSNRVTPNGVGLLPVSQARHCQRVQPALSVTAFSRASSPIGRAKGRAAPAQSRPPPAIEPGDPQRCGSTASFLCSIFSGMEKTRLQRLGRL